MDKGGHKAACRLTFGIPAWIDPRDAFGQKMVASGTSEAGRLTHDVLVDSWVGADWDGDLASKVLRLCKSL